MSYVNEGERKSLCSSPAAHQAAAHIWLLWCKATRSISTPTGWDDSSSVVLPMLDLDQ